ncbi:hypothetical protein [Flavobacterium sp.]|uniref:hypothetical protein n=1 Tax=Flavobacterium sp. TaxID=239 RepID=UPI002FDAA84C
MKKIILLLAIAPFLLATSCDDDDQIYCTQEAKAGLNITVKDAVTNEYLSTGITVIAQDGSYTETLEAFPQSDIPVFMGAYERVGTYIFTVSKEGYQTYTSELVTLTADVCHVIPQNFLVELQPN